MKDVSKLLEELKEARRNVNKKAEYLDIDICCPDEESRLMDYETIGKLTLEKVVEIHNNHECCGCDQCNIPDFI